MEKLGDGKLKSLDNYVVAITASFSILGLILMRTLGSASAVSEGILGITGLVVLWYTWETSQIRKAENTIAEASRYKMESYQRPVVGCNVFTNADRPFDTRLSITNLSDNPLAAQVNCNFKIDGEPIENFSSAYDGTFFGWQDGLLQHGSTRNTFFLGSYSKTGKSH